MPLRSQTIYFGHARQNMFGCVSPGSDFWLLSNSGLSLDRRRMHMSLSHCCESLAFRHSLSLVSATSKLAYPCQFEGFEDWVHHGSSEKLFELGFPCCIVYFAFRVRVCVCVLVGVPCHALGFKTGCAQPFAAGLIIPQARPHLASMMGSSCACRVQVTVQDWRLVPRWHLQSFKYRFGILQGR